MAVFFKRHSDAGAPQITWQPGVYIALFDWFLVGMLGWTKPFSGVNIAVYKQPAGTNGFYLRVDDSMAAAAPCGARVVGYEQMTDVNTGVNPFPTTAQSNGGLYLTRSNTVNVMQYRIWGSGGLFYLWGIENNWNYSEGMIFGDFTSFRPGDQFNTIIACQPTSFNNNTLSAVPLLANTAYASLSGHYTARPYTQQGTAINSGKFSDYAKQGQTQMGVGGNLTYPTQADQAMYLAPVWVNDGGYGDRGYLPGIWSPCHSYPMTMGDTFTCSTGLLAGRSFECIASGLSYNHGCFFVDTSDTWGGI